jgi:hypothetical protein
MSDIITALKFVQGSIAKKDLVQELTHYVIHNGRVSGFNGVLGLSSPIPFSIDCKPKAAPFIKAIDNCNDTVQLSMTPGGKLTVKSGSFKVHIASFEGDTCHEQPQGQFVYFDSESFYAGVKRMAPFMGEDASRKWAQGILIKDKSFYATNNVVLAQYWLGVEFPHELCIPAPAVKELLRIKEAPKHAQVTENSITFHFEGDRWLRTQLYNTDEWPNLDPILNMAGVPTPIPEGLFPALDVLKPFVDNLERVYINNGKVFTHFDESEGASYEVAGMLHEGIFNLRYLKLLEGNATHVDFSTWPKPCMFTGDKFRGAIVGIKA